MSRRTSTLQPFPGGRRPTARRQSIKDGVPHGFLPVSPRGSVCLPEIHEKYVYTTMRIYPSHLDLEPELVVTQGVSITHRSLPETRRQSIFLGDRRQSVFLGERRQSVFPVDHIDELPEFEAQDNRYIKRLKIISLYRKIGNGY